MEQERANRAKIEGALSALLQRENDDAFVIFEEKQSGKFVQFAGRTGENLFLDVPFQTLTRTEAERARVYFHDLGVQAEEYDVFDGPGGNVAGRQRSFQKPLGQDIDRAARIVMQVFERVYQFPAHFELVVTEN